MPNLMKYKKSDNATSGVNCGITNILLQSIGTILTKRSGLMPDLFTQLKAMYSAFIGKSHSWENIVKMVYDVS